MIKPHIPFASESLRDAPPSPPPLARRALRADPPILKRLGYTIGLTLALSLLMTCPSAGAEEGVMPASRYEKIRKHKPSAKIVEKKNATVAAPAAITPLIRMPLAPSFAQPVAPTVSGGGYAFVADVAPAISAPAANPVASQADPSAPLPADLYTLPDYVEAGVDYARLTNHQGNQFSQYARIEIQSDTSNRWSAEISNQHAFRDDGTYGVIGNTHVFNENWYSDINVGAGTDVFFLPNIRADAFINRKWLEKKNFLTTLGLGVYDAQDVYTDYSIFLGTTYYFDSPWVVQQGLRLNVSTPGNVLAPSGFVAVTNGTYKDYLLTLTLGGGREAYQLIGPGDTLSKFYSESVSIGLKDWLGEDYGFVARGEYYHNPNYNRVGGRLGVFKEF